MKRTKMPPRDHRVSFTESQYHVIDPTNLCCALDDGIEHRLHVCRRAADDAEHLSRCRLMLEGLAQFGVAFLDLIEQSDVFDCNDCLISKGFKQLDLFIRKGTDFWSANMNRPDRNSFTK